MIQIAYKTLWKKVKFLKMSNFTFFHNLCLKLFSSMCQNEYIWRKVLDHIKWFAELCCFLDFEFSLKMNSQTSLFLHFCSINPLKTLWEKEKLPFSLFPQCFLSFSRTFCHFYQISNCRLQTLSVWKSLKFAVWYMINVAEF